jgi:L-arabinokinase
VSSAVVFLISGHGFGHASRQVEVINALVALQPSLGGLPGEGRVGPIVVATTADPALLARTIRGPYHLIPISSDPGIVQRDSVTHDDDASALAAARFYDSFDARVEEACRALDRVEPGLIVGDIPPLAFAVADRLGVRSIAIANFTWDWIYEAMPEVLDRAPRLLQTIRQAYARATSALELPFSGGFDVFPVRQSLPLIARHASRTRAETRAHLGLPHDGKVVLLSFGGYGLPGLRLDGLSGLEDWTIVTTDRTSGVVDRGQTPGVRGQTTIRINESVFLDGSLRYEDLVAAADAVITKPGYGIIAECAANDTALVYTSRGAFREYDLLVEEMPRVVRCAFLPQEDLRAGRWRDALELAVAAPRPPRPRTDGAEVAASAIVDQLTRGAR